MEMTVYNPQKGRIETLNITIDETNTTWFEDYLDMDDIYMITDIDAGLLIRKACHSYPVLIYDLTRAEIAYSPQKAKELLDDLL